MSAPHQALLMLGGAGGGPGPGPVLSSMLAWWEMNDNAGNTDVVDSRSFKNLFINANTSTVTQTGKVGAALRVANSGAAIAMRLATQNDTAFDFTGNTAFTVGGWVKWASATAPDYGERVFGRIGGSAGANAYGIERQSATSTLFGVASDGSGNTSPSGISITSTNWNFVVVRHDPVADTIALRVNATTNSASHSTGINASADTDWTIGRHAVRSTGVFDTTGTNQDKDYDSVFVSNIALSDANLDAIYNAGAGLSYAAFVGLGI